jgi:hypothetical protein
MAVPQSKLDPWICQGCRTPLDDDLADRWCDQCRPRLYAALARRLRGSWGFAFGPSLQQVFARPGRGPAHGGRRTLVNDEEVICDPAESDNAKAGSVSRPVRTRSRQRRRASANGDLMTL